ncbi:MAG: T9SS type A sorting domain-containing protein [bacterium]
MKQRLAVIMLVTLALRAVLPAVAAAAPEDVIWARRTTSPITLDGVLNEPAWAKAESVAVVYGRDAGVPGSGWKVEAGAFVATDSTKAVFKFLVVGNQLYFAATVKDSSVGGSASFNRFDGFLMSIKDHSSTANPKPPTEYFYSWWYPLLTDPQPPGQLPRFKGRWANDSTTVPRDSTQIANWDAMTVVHGQSNNDAVIDQGYTVEMRFNLTPMGYDVTQARGDTVEWNIAIYDTDWFWPYDALKFYCNRVWWQSPWGSDAWYDEVRIHARPDVTVDSGALPAVNQELSIPELAGAAPTINGTLTEPVWSDPRIYSFDIRYNDNALRQTYPGVGPYRAGQYQPTVNGGTADVVDPGDATVKMFYKGTDLYLGFDVRDRVVQYHPSFDRWDGFIVTMNDKVARGTDNQLLGYRLSFQVAQNGTALPQDDLASFVTAGNAQIALALKPGTVVDTLGTTPDTGYTAELRLSLPALGFPAGLGDHIAWIGVNLLDGDSFLPVTDSYGTRTWWFRQYQGDCCPARALLAPLTAVAAQTISERPREYVTRAFPNPSAQPTIQYALPQPGQVSLELYDVSGRLVASRGLGLHSPGTWETSVDGAGMAAGVYFYRLRLTDPESGSTRATLQGKIVLMK